MLPTTGDRAEHRARRPASRSPTGGRNLGSVFTAPTHGILAEIIGPDLLIVLVLIGLLFGSARLPKLARSLGSAKSEFEKGLHEGAAPAPDPPAPAPPPAEERVTLTRAELDALIADREERARRSTPPPDAGG